MSTNQTNQAVPQGARVNSHGALHIPRFAGMQLTGGPKHRAKTRQNAALPGELWQQLDDTIIDVYREQTDIVNDLRDAGLTTTVPMENEYTYWYKSRPMGEARTSMTPEPQTAEVTASFERDGAPLPFVHDDFSIGFRERPSPNGELTFSADDMETYLAEQASYNVQKEVESLIINGAPGELGSTDGFQAYGLLNHPSRNTGTFGTDWTDRTNGGPSSIRRDLRNMISDLKEDGFRGGEASYRVYMSTDYEEVLRDADPEGDGNRTVMDRVEQLPELQDMGISQFLPEKTVVMLRFTSDVIDLAVAEDMQTIQWSDNPGFRDYFKVFTCMVPRIKSTMNDECGIVHYTAP